MRYGKAVAHWLAAGRPVRLPAQVQEILTTHCQTCLQFDTGKCKLCGCRVNCGHSALLNKLRMATEACPLGKWIADEKAPIDPTPTRLPDSKAPCGC